ncbi:hypothetical protein BD410DRAFT_800583 [Rickenella mellea]|uniref:Uncharacterized protein n=1 Tax=Rickenella mellea TaxID=50990 RepID=A0A4Y7QGF3_9AGAM|nr:hypothetical protein BD410DRAFT_800583 [Rickenella mellea]
MSRPSSPPLRPQSPRLIEHIPRPPSRSESLLRDTLRRVEEYERHHVRSPSNRQRRQRKESYTGPVGAPHEFTDGECECDEDHHQLHPARRNGSFDFFFGGQQPAVSAPRSVRRRSASRSPEDTRHQLPYGSPASPSPLPPVFARTRTAPVVPGVATTRDGIAAPTPHAVRPGRHSMPNTVNPVDAFHVHSNSNDSPRQLTFSPHEAVLRARLEGVLMRAGVQEEPSEARKQVGKPTGKEKGHGRAKSHSVSVVAKPGEWSYTATTASPDSTTNSSTSDLTKSKSSLVDHDRGTGTSTSNASSPRSPMVPITPPPTPPFNARIASEVCKRMDGYVSFASIEGLGEPPGMNISADEAMEAPAAWKRWLRVWPFVNPGMSQDTDDSRSRGESQERPASR